MEDMKYARRPTNEQLPYLLVEQNKRIDRMIPFKKRTKEAKLHRKIYWNASFSKHRPRQREKEEQVDREDPWYVLKAQSQISDVAKGEGMRAVLSAAASPWRYDGSEGEIDVGWRAQTCTHTIRPANDIAPMAGIISAQD